VWQELRAELQDDGLEVVTVALDSAGPEAARPWIERAHPLGPSTEYDTDWATEVERAGVDRYYPPLDM
jgi:hypothetical protein